MKKILFASFSLLFILSCKEKEDHKDDVSSKKVELPVEVMYKGTAAIGNPENMVTVMNWNKNMISGDVTAAGNLIADSLTVTLSDGMHVELAHDSAVAFLGGWRSSMDSAKQSYGAIIAVDNKDAGDEWVIQWTKESYFYKTGKSETVNLNESYRLVNGKIREVSQYARAVPAVK
jgi:hypothetical protein